MMLDHMVFAFIEKLIQEGDFKKAAYNLYMIAKSNKMRKLTERLSGMYNRAKQLKIYSGALDETFASVFSEKLRHDLELALGSIKNKNDLEIEYPKTMSFKFYVDDNKLKGAKGQKFMNTVSQIREMGLQVSLLPRKS